MKGFTIVGPALETPASVLYIDEAISLATQLAFKFREEMRVFANLKDKSELVGIIYGNRVDDYMFKPEEEVLNKGKPDRV